MCVGWWGLLKSELSILIEVKTVSVRDKPGAEGVAVHGID